MKSLPSAATWILGIWAYSIAMLAGSALGKETGQPEIKQAPAANGTYVFKPAAITPSPDGKAYNGRFLFINKGATPLMVSGFDEPANGKFEPRFVRYQTLKGGAWKELPMGYCGTGARDFPMKPLQPYEFHAGLDRFDEQDTPVTARIGFDVYADKTAGWVEYWSDPFVLDWKKDRGSGKFTAAKQEHDKEVRAAFSKAGFSDELLADDDFYRRVLQSILKEFHTQGAAASFSPFVGKLDVTPSLELDGSIRIDFTSDEVRNSETEYRGWFRLDPEKFNRQWFDEAVKHHVKVGKWGAGVQMALDDGSSWKSPLYLCINYVPFNRTKAPTDEEAKTAFARLLEALGKCLKR